jgi:hypothetical protein
MFSKPWIKAEEFGPTASYGYGIAVDKLDDHTILRHTGGMVSFASALQVDLDASVGAFASINAMQGYRPNPVAQYAIQLMRAVNESKPMPKPPELSPATKTENAIDYQGMYEGTGGKLQFIAEGQALVLKLNNSSFQLENAGSGRFLCPNSQFSRFLFAFERADDKNPKSPVVAVGWGGDWYTNEKYSGAKTFDYPKEWNAYPGHYRNESPWDGSFRIVLRKGKLMIDGVILLEQTSDGAFVLRDEEWNTEWIRFFDVVNGKAMRLKVSGDDFWRLDAS